MPLTKRQKRRLLEVSKMIESVVIVYKELSEIQVEYIAELDDLVNKVRGQKQNSQPETVSSTDLSVYEEISSLGETQEAQESTNKTGSASYPDEVLETPDAIAAPEWTRKLWKRIAKKCHPDRLPFQNLTPLDFAKRQEWFLESKVLFEKQNWNRLVHIGIQVDEYIDDMPVKQQMSMVNDEYNKLSKRVATIQDSLAWQWGTNWENIELRTRILSACLKHAGVKIPSKLKLIEIILSIEKD